MKLVDFVIKKMKKIDYVDQNLTNFDPLPRRVDKRGNLHTPPVHVEKRWTKAPPA